MTLTYIVKVIILSNLQKILVAHYSLKSYDQKKNLKVSLKFEIYHMKQYKIRHRFAVTKNQISFLISIKK